VQLILDYGCPRLFTAIVLTNGNEGSLGTKFVGDFTVYGSNDFLNKTVLVSGTLPDPGANTVSILLIVIISIIKGLVGIQNCLVVLKKFVRLLRFSNNISFNQRCC
jgi:hypothetical protein